MNCLGSFLLHDMLKLNLYEFAFEGQTMKFTVNILLSCTLYCAPGIFLRSILRLVVLAPHDWNSRAFIVQARQIFDKLTNSTLTKIHVSSTLQASSKHLDLQY